MSYYADGMLDPENAQLVQSGFAQWMKTDGLKPADLAARCSVDVLQAALSHLDGVKVISATINRSGKFAPPEPHWVPNMAPAPSLILGLPDFCEVLIHQDTPGNHVAKILVWVPLAWNQRFLATGGMGSITGPVWFDQPTIRTMTMPIALRNGFATAATDAGNRDPRFFEWPMNPDTGALDWELLRNWAYRSNHDMAVVAKAVIEALHGKAPSYSYYAGCSGGGRQGLASVQYHPEDFDGVWASDAALNWTSLWPAAMWPALVMKELDNVLPEAKLEAFRAAAVEACDGADGLRDGIIGVAEFCDFDPHTIVGQSTSAGAMTATDADVMKMLWDGPRRANGERLGFGLPPGTNSWGFVGMWKSSEVDGKLIPLARETAAYYRWLLEDLNFDWMTLDFARFEELTDLGIKKFAEFAINNPDLSGLRDSGGKLLMSQAVNDPIIQYGCVVDYYQRVMDTCGGDMRTKSFARLFCTDGDIHGTIAGLGPGLTTASAMTALMKWVENDHPPEKIIAERVDVTTGKVIATRPTFPYPAATSYSGSGDPSDAASYVSTMAKSSRTDNSSI